MQSSNCFLKWLCVSLGIALTILFVSGCSKQSPSGQPTNTTTIRIGYRPKALADITPVILQNRFTNEYSDLKLRFIALSSADDGFTKFKAGEIDVIAGMPMEKVFQQLVQTNTEKHFQAYYLQVDKAGEGWVSLVGSKKAGIAKLSDLAGKTTASLNTDQAEYLLRHILLGAGITEGQIKIVRYNPATPLIGLRNGEHAAIFGLEPAISQAVNEGNPVLAKGPVSHFMFGDKPVPLSASLIDLEFLRQHPKAVTEFYSLVDRAVLLTAEKPELVTSYFAKQEFGDLSPGVAAKLSLPTMEKPSPQLQATVQEFVNRLVEDKVLPSKINVSLIFP